MTEQELKNKHEWCKNMAEMILCIHDNDNLQRVFTGRYRIFTYTSDDFREAGSLAGSGCKREDSSGMDWVYFTKKFGSDVNPVELSITIERKLWDGHWPGDSESSFITGLRRKFDL